MINDFCNGMVRNIIASAGLFIIFSINLYAQKPVKICGEYTYIVPENVSYEEAKNIAVERAKIEALAVKFGTIVSQTNTTIIKAENEKSNTSFTSLGGTEVKGEWLRDTEKPFIKRSLENNVDVIFVKVCGEAREISSAGIDFSAKILKNGTDDRFESDFFKHKDELFLAFRSPVNGFLAVYLLDDEKTAFCLLPYMKDPSGKTQIQAGKDYVFFSDKYAAPEEKSFVHELELICDKSAEQNHLYIIFSPNEFIKANDASGGEMMPRKLSFDDFQKWLTKNRQRDKDMKVVIKSITINK